VASLSAPPNVDAVYKDEHEWVEPWKRGANIISNSVVGVIFS
jgi:hypothetical protein